METDTILEVNNLAVTIDADEILKGISFTASKGEALAIIGPNGAGKSILLQALLGLVAHEGGLAWKKGIKIGYVPQKFFVDRSVPFTVREFFLLKGPRFWFPSLDFLHHLAHELSLVGLQESVLRKAMGDLSKGQLQRVLIAWAMLDHPDVLLFDEPTAGIDIGAEETIYTVMHKMQDERGTTILLVSHDLNVVYRYADNVLCIDKEMICHGRPQEVLNPEELTRIYGEGGFYHHLDMKK